MACLYLCLGQRFGMDVDLVDLAGRLLVHMRDSKNAISYLIDPLDNGKQLTEDDCRQYIHSRGLEKEQDLFTPLSSRLIVRRFIANMIYALNKIHDARRLKFLRNYLEIINAAGCSCMNGSTKLNRLSLLPSGSGEVHAKALATTHIKAPYGIIIYSKQP